MFLSIAVEFGRFDVDPGLRSFLIKAKVDNHQQDSKSQQDSMGSRSKFLCLSLSQ